LVTDRSDVRYLLPDQGPEGYNLQREANEIVRYLKNCEEDENLGSGLHYRWVRAPNPNEPKDIVHIKIIELVNPLGDYSEYDTDFSDVVDFFVEWRCAPAGRKTSILHHLDERCHELRLARPELPPDFTPLSKFWEIPDDKVWDVLNRIIEYLGLFVDNNLVKSHKELRPGNIFVDRKTFELEFGFPLCAVSNQWLLEENVELEYLAPELPKGPRDAYEGDWAHLGPNADAWSFGVIAYRLIIGSVPDTHVQDELTGRLMEMAGRFRWLTPKIVTLIVSCMNTDANARTDVAGLVRAWIGSQDEYLE
jgi:hypothetical protein